MSAGPSTAPSRARSNGSASGGGPICIELLRSGSANEQSGGLQKMETGRRIPDRLTEPWDASPSFPTPRRASQRAPECPGGFESLGTRRIFRQRLVELPGASQSFRLPRRAFQGVAESSGVAQSLGAPHRSLECFLERCSAAQNLPTPLRGSQRLSESSDAPQNLRAVRRIFYAPGEHSGARWSPLRAALRLHGTP